MKKIFNILAASLFMIGMTACNEIEEDNYFKPNNEVSEHVPLSDDDISNWVNEKVVLLEDYTGVRCQNCPNAAEIAHDLQEQYGHQLVVLGVHAGGMTNPQGGFPDFRTEEGTEWFNNFNIETNPNGTINRQKRGDVYKYGADEWAGAVAEAVVGQPNIRLLTALEYDDATRELKVSAYSKFLAEFSDLYNVTVCIMEDNIVGKQIGAPDPTNYTHRHVFRKTMNSEWGTELNDAVIAPDTEIVKTFSLKMDEQFNVDNCYVIAYVYLRESREILQVTEKKIK